jgi:hypothetical protein
MRKLLFLLQNRQQCYQILSTKEFIKMLTLAPDRALPPVLQRQRHRPLLSGAVHALADPRR